MSNNSTRPLRTQDQRLVETIVGLDRDFLQKLKVVGSDVGISFSGLGGAIGSSVPGKPQGATGSFLSVAGGSMKGAIAYGVQIAKIDSSGSVDVTPVTGVYTGYLVISPHSGLSGTLQQIIGAHDDGQQLWIQAVATETITIKNDPSGNGSGGFNIRTPGLADFVLKGPQAVEVYFDPIQNQWAFVQASFFDNISSGAISGNLDMHNYKILDVGRLEFTNGGIMDNSKNSIFATGQSMFFTMPFPGSSFQFAFHGVTSLEIFENLIQPYNTGAGGAVTSMILGNSTHILFSADIANIGVWSTLGFYDAPPTTPGQLTGWLTDSYPYNNLGVNLGHIVTNAKIWNNLYMGGTFELREGTSAVWVDIYKSAADHYVHHAIFDPYNFNNIGFDWKVNGTTYLSIYLNSAATDKPISGLMIWNFAPIVILDGSCIFFQKASGAPALGVPPLAGQGNLYIQDNGAGKGQLVVQWHSGSVSAIVTEP